MNYEFFFSAVDCGKCTTNFPPLLVHNIVSLVHMTNALVIIIKTTSIRPQRRVIIHALIIIIIMRMMNWILQWNELMKLIGFVWIVLTFSARFDFGFAPQRPRGAFRFRYDANSIPGKHICSPHLHIGISLSLSLSLFRLGKAQFVFGIDCWFVDWSMRKHCWALGWLQRLRRRVTVLCS